MFARDMMIGGPSTKPIEQIHNLANNSRAKLEIYVEVEGKLYNYSIFTYVKNAQAALNPQFFEALKSTIPETKLKKEEPKVPSMSFSKRDSSVNLMKEKKKHISKFMGLSSPRDEKKEKEKEKEKPNHLESEDSISILVNKPKEETLGFTDEPLEPRKLFGHPLDTYLNQTTLIPPFLEKSMLYIFLYGLTSVGIFRLAGTKSDLDEIQQQIESGHKIDIKSRELDVVVIACLIKKYLRELPEPLIPSSLYQQFISLGMQDGVQQEEINSTIRELLKKIPQSNYNTLHELICLSFQIHINSGINRMNGSNLAIVIGPNILRSANESNFSMSENTANQVVVKHLIVNYEDIFTNPPISKQYKYAQFLCKWVGHKKSIIQLTTNTNKTHLISVDISGFIRIYNPQTYEFIEEIETSQQVVLAAECIQDTMWIGSMKSFQIWTTTTDDVSCLFSLPEGCWALAPVGDVVWTCNGHEIIVYHSQNYSEVHKMAGSVVKFLHVDDTVWGALSDSSIAVWDESTYEVICKLETPHKKINKLLRVQDHIWVCCNRKIITIWDIKSREIIKTLNDAHSDKVFGLIYHSGVVWSSSWEGDIKIWDPNNFTCLEQLQNEHADSVECLAALEVKTKTGEVALRIFSGGCDKAVCMWEPQTP